MSKNAKSAKKTKKKSQPGKGEWEPEAVAGESIKTLSKKKEKNFGGWVVVFLAGFYPRFH